MATGHEGLVNCIMDIQHYGYPTRDMCISYLEYIVSLTIWNHRIHLKANKPGPASITVGILVLQRTRTTKKTEVIDGRIM